VQLIEIFMAATGSRVVTAIVLLLLVAVTSPAFKKSAPAPENEFVRQNTVGLGGALANVAEFLAFNLTFVIATLAGIVVGTVYTLAIQPVFLCFMLFAGIATATSVRVAEAFGKKDGEGVKNAGRLGVAAGLVSGLFILMIVFVFRGAIAEGMAASDQAVSTDVVALLSGVLAVATLMILFDGLQIIASMALRAQEIIWVPVAIHLFSFLIVMLPAAYVFTLQFGWGAQGTMWGVVLGSMCAGIGQVAYLEYKTARRKIDAPL